MAVDPPLTSPPYNYSSHRKVLSGVEGVGALMVQLLHLLVQEYLLRFDDGSPSTTLSLSLTPHPSTRPLVEAMQILCRAHAVHAGRNPHLPPLVSPLYLQHYGSEQVSSSSSSSSSSAPFAPFESIPWFHRLIVLLGQTASSPSSGQTEGSGLYLCSPGRSIVEKVPLLQANAQLLSLFPSMDLTALFFAHLGKIATQRRQFRTGSEIENGGSSSVAELWTPAVVDGTILSMEGHTRGRESLSAKEAIVNDSSSSSSSPKRERNSRKEWSAFPAQLPYFLRLVSVLV